MKEPNSHRLQLHDPGRLYHFQLRCFSETSLHKDCLIPNCRKSYDFAFKVHKPKFERLVADLDE